MSSSLKEFVRDLLKSRLMSDAEIQEFRNSLPKTDRPKSVEAFARELVKREVLTSYQVSRVLDGETAGLVLGNNVILDRIGEGGMGEVFRAEHRTMKRPVCVKVLPATATKSEQLVRRFQREVQAAAKLAHPNIVTAFDAGESDGVHFLVMEFADGVDLGTKVSQKGPLPVYEAVDCIIQAARGLAYAHEQGVVHRDIKPSNLLRDVNGVLKILDMGLARIDEQVERDEVSGDAITSEHQIVGTVDYMSPEQADASSEVDGRSDIYSLGCTFHRLVTGSPPYRGSTAIEILMAHRMHPIPSLTDQLDGIPKSVDDVYHKMVAKHPDDRFASMSEVIDALSVAIEDISDRELVARPLPPGLTGGSSDELTAELDDSELDADRQTNTSVAHHTRAETFDLGPIPRSRDSKPPAGRRAEERAAGAPNLTSQHGQAADADESEADKPIKTVGAKPIPPKPKKYERPRAVGIDLGTTFSAIAFLDDLDRPETLLNAEGDKITPSVLLFEDGDVIAGKEAVKAMATEMVNIADCAKRDLGNSFYRRPLGDRHYPPEALQAWLLHKIVSDAERKLGEIQKVVITVPAYFDETRRKATQDAGYVAGLDVIDIINEPTAAAIAFAYQRGLLEQTLQRPERILIYDLGGGTFDVTITEVKDGECRTVATDGDVQLGGRDWDQRLIDHVAQKFIHDFGRDPRQDANTAGRLWRECEDAKHTLSARSKASIACDFGGQAMRVEVARAEFEQMTGDLLDRTNFTTRQTLLAAGLSWDDIDRVLLVGGSTRMPAVVEMLRRLSGKEPDRSVSPDEAVAHGAAIHAGMLLDRYEGRPPRLKVRNVNSHSLGVVATDTATGRKQNAILIPRNTALPASAKRVFQTHHANQGSIRVEVVEGESLRPESCSAVGKCGVRDLPENLPAHTPIEVRFRYEENGRLAVQVKVAGEERAHEFARANSLSSEQLDQWRLHVSGKQADRQPSEV